ncbi:hypothetical protein AOLI_G00032040 [Acnodon oligacanthus]
MESRRADQATAGEQGRSSMHSSSTTSSSPDGSISTSLTYTMRCLDCLSNMILIRISLPLKSNLNRPPKWATAGLQGYGQLEKGAVALYSSQAIDHPASRLTPIKPSAIRPSHQGSALRDMGLRLKAIKDFNVQQSHSHPMSLAFIRTGSHGYKREHVR